MINKTMRTYCAAAFMLLLLCVGIIWHFSTQNLPSARILPVSESVRKPDAAKQAKALENYGNLPISFEANQGQVSGQVKFLSRGSGYTLFLTEQSAVLALSGNSSASDAGAPQHEPANAYSDVVRMRLVGANPAARVSGVEEQPGKTNYIVGNDPTQWRTNVANYSRVKYESVYPGVDLVYYGNQRQLEYDFVVAPGADPAPISLDLQTDSAQGNSRSLHVATNGDLVVAAAGREVRFSKPLIYQPVDADARHTIDGRWVITDKTRVGFEVASYDTSKPLIIDPALNYSTYLGGSLFNPIYSVAVDSSGNAYVTGGVTSTDFPVTAGALQPKYGGDHDAFVTKLNASGTALVYSTYLGGSGIDHGSGIAVDASGSAYVAGTTSSKNFPVTTGAFQTVCHGCNGTSPDGFITKLNAAGSGLVYSTFLGGSGYEHFAAITIDNSGDAYVTGFSCSTDYPTTPGAFQTALKGACTSFGGNVVVSELNASGSALVLSTYLGGTGTDAANSVEVDQSGNVFVAGYSTSTDFPTTSGAFQTTNAGKNDVIVAGLNSSGTALVYSTYVGGSGDDQAWGLKLDSSGNAYVVGQTMSANFPVTAGAFQTVCGSCTATTPQTDGFVVKLNPSGSALAYSTFLGGSSEDVTFAISLGPTGDAYVAGETQSKDFKTTPAAFQTVKGASTSAFISHLDPTGASEIYSTLLGNNASTILGISVNPSNGAIYVAGRTYATSFPVTPGAFQTTCNTCNITLKNADGFITEFINGDQIWPLTLNFNNQTVGVRSPVLNAVLSNSSSTTLNVSKIQITGSSAFTKTADTCSSPIAVGSSCTISTVFTPTAIGTQNATLTVTDDAANGPHQVLLSGTGTYVQFKPGTLNFGKQTVGTQSLSRSVTLTNKSGNALNITGITLMGTNPGDFAQTNTCGSSVGAGGNCTITVTFTPTAKGPRTAAVAVSDNGGGSPQQVPLTGTGT